MKPSLLAGRAIVVAALVLALFALTRVAADFAKDPNDPLTTRSAREATVDDRG